MLKESVVENAAEAGNLLVTKKILVGQVTMLVMKTNGWKIQKIAPQVKTKTIKAAKKINGLTKSPVENLLAETGKFVIKPGNEIQTAVFPVMVGPVQTELAEVIPLLIPITMKRNVKRLAGNGETTNVTAHQLAQEGLQLPEINLAVGVILSMTKGTAAMGLRSIKMVTPGSPIATRSVKATATVRKIVPKVLLIRRPQTGVMALIMVRLPVV